MFAFKIFTTRPTTDNPFWPYSTAGQIYEEIMDLTKAAWPTEGDLGLLDVIRTESPDGLSLTTEYIFQTTAGKNALLDNFAIRALTHELIPVSEARDIYNASVGHTSIVTFKKIQPTV